MCNKSISQKIYPSFQSSFTILSLYLVCIINNWYIFSRTMHKLYQSKQNWNKTLQKASYNDKITEKEGEDSGSKKTE